MITIGNESIWVSNKYTQDVSEVDWKKFKFNILLGNDKILIDNSNSGYQSEKTIIVKDDVLKVGDPVIITDKQNEIKRTTIATAEVYEEKLNSISYYSRTCLNNGINRFTLLYSHKDTNYNIYGEFDKSVSICGLENLNKLYIWSTDINDYNAVTINTDEPGTTLMCSHPGSIYSATNSTKAYILSIQYYSDGDNSYFTIWKHHIDFIGGTIMDNEKLITIYTVSNIVPINYRYSDKLNGFIIAYGKSDTSDVVYFGLITDNGFTYIDKVYGLAGIKYLWMNKLPEGSKHDIFVTYFENVAESNDSNLRTVYIDSNNKLYRSFINTNDYDIYSNGFFIKPKQDGLLLFANNNNEDYNTTVFNITYSSYTETKLNIVLNDIITSNDTYLIIKAVYNNYIYKFNIYTKGINKLLDVDGNYSCSILENTELLCYITYPSNNIRVSIIDITTGTTLFYKDILKYLDSALYNYIIDKIAYRCHIDNDMFYLKMLARDDADTKNQMFTITINLRTKDVKQSKRVDPILGKELNVNTLISYDCPLVLGSNQREMIMSYDGYYYITGYRTNANVICTTNDSLTNPIVEAHMDNLDLYVSVSDTSDTVRAMSQDVTVISSTLNTVTISGNIVTKDDIVRINNITYNIAEVVYDNDNDTSTIQIDNSPDLTGTTEITLVENTLKLVTYTPVLTNGYISLDYESYIKQGRALQFKIETGINRSISNVQVVTYK